MDTKTMPLEQSTAALLYRQQAIDNLMFIADYMVSDVEGECKSKMEVATPYIVTARDKHGNLETRAFYRYCNKKMVSPWTPSKNYEEYGTPTEDLSCALRQFLELTEDYVAITLLPLAERNGEIERRNHERKSALERKKKQAEAEAKNEAGVEPDMEPDREKDNKQAEAKREIERDEQVNASAQHGNVWDRIGDQAVALRQDVKVLAQKVREANEVSRSLAQKMASEPASKLEPGQGPEKGLEDGTEEESLEDIRMIIPRWFFPVEEGPANKLQNKPEDKQVAEEIEVEVKPTEPDAASSTGTLRREEDACSDLREGLMTPASDGSIHSSTTMHDGLLPDIAIGLIDWAHCLPPKSSEYKLEHPSGKPYCPSVPATSSSRTSSIMTPTPTPTCPSSAKGREEGSVKIGEMSRAELREEISSVFSGALLSLVQQLQGALEKH